MPEGNGAAGLEFSRFGGSIPTSYWGCCCADVIQNFKVDPDAPSSIQITAGDSGLPCMRNGEYLFCGPTHRDVFHQRLRIGTFGDRDMPNHAFFAILTQWQVTSDPGRKWLPILKEAGFEFLRSVSNSVGAGQSLLVGEPGVGTSVNHVFALFRNIGAGALRDPFSPPKEWTDISSTHPEPWEIFAEADNVTPETYARAQREAQLLVWNRIGPVTFMTEKEVVAAGAPVFMAGERSRFPPQEKSVREREKGKDKPPTPVSSAFPGNPAPSA